jgi:hypothetical protein
MANVRTVDFLPEIFQTPANKQFMAATLDQLVQEPRFTKKQGFIGRRIGDDVRPTQTTYVPEIDQTRADYQLEPGIVQLDSSRQQLVDAITYPGLSDALQTQGAAVGNNDRLYTSDYYTWDPFVDFDKYVNYGQYYWLPNGPTAVDVFNGEIAATNEYVVTKSPGSYSIRGVAGRNPELTLVRGGSYQFLVDQNSQFWIQQEPGTSGTQSANQAFSSRDIFGVTNNGASQGVVTFQVPFKDEQDFFFNLTDAGTVDIISENIKFNELNNVFLSEFLRKFPDGIDGIKNLNGRTIIFTNKDTGVVSGGWGTASQFDPLPELTSNNGFVGSYDTTTFAQETAVPPENRFSIWRIRYTSVDGAEPFIELVQPTQVANLSKLTVLFGNKYANTQWWKDILGFWNQMPNLTALFDTLYYQDSVDSNAFGVIKLIEPDQVGTLDIEGNILGKAVYTSPNGVVFTNNIKVVFRGDVQPVSYRDQEFYVAGVGTGIKLLPVGDYVTPETYSDNSVVGILDEPDYIVMSLDSISLTTWSRVNRWFHVDVINATFGYTNVEIVLEDRFRAKRPILEFRGGLKLFNAGVQALPPIDIIDFDETDALSNINGAEEYTVDGYTLETGSRVVFAADEDSQVRNKIYQVTFITPDSDDPTPVINLTPVDTQIILPDQSVLILGGDTKKGTTFYFDGVNWIESQKKVSRNQAPLFDVYDLDGVSFSDTRKYLSTTFNGSKLFSYATGIGAADPILKFPLKYQTLNNVGDILFDNNLYTDKFLYVEGTVGTSKNISDGLVKEYQSRLDFKTIIGWQPAVTKNRNYQQFRFEYDPTQPLILDVPVDIAEPIPAVKIYVNGNYQTPDTYTLSVNLTTTTIVLVNPERFAAGTDIEVLALSNVPSRVGFYQIPDNLENNPLNENSKTFTLGTARIHYQSIAENLKDFRGSIIGINNIRDLGNIIPFGLRILQQSAPLTLTGYFLRNSQYDIFASIDYNRKEYEKFKSKMLSLAIANDYNGLSPSEILDSVIDELANGKTENNSFFWSDMMPSGTVFTENRTVFTPISVSIFDTLRVYDFKSSNYQGLLVYVNNQLLTRNTDYEVATDGPRLTITKPLATGDVVVIREYANTAGSYIPNTPTKLGLYPAYQPIKFVDNTTPNNPTVIRGHDGSITVAFGDFRDDLLLEFEKRIYNNLKLDGNPVPLTVADVVPGQFRSTDYSLNEINTILSKDFLSWVAQNNLDYKTQTYFSNNEFTFNYSRSGSRLDNNRALPVGGWRGLYTYFYDTINPNTRPWEMLGFSEEPTWWQNYYGPAPYTEGNLVLWDDLEQGLVRDPAGEYTIEKYRRPGLTSIIPSDAQGNLLSPLNSLVSEYSTLDFKKSWVFGDDAPVENVWRSSSSYPFAIMRLLALTRPAEFFSLFADRDLYRYDENLNQYLYNRRYRLDANGIEVYGNGVSKASYINWIVDFNRQFGVDGTQDLTNALKALDVRLCYRMAGFSAKNLIQLFTERAGPTASSVGLLWPDESYNLLVYKNVPFDRLTYSSVIVQRTEAGFAVWGYSTLTPYFDILQSRPAGNPTTLSAGGASVQVSTAHLDQVVSVPYGYVFPTVAGVADFLISYGARLERQGMVFDDSENGYLLTWQQMVSEFLYWTTQGWETGSLINLNPCARKLTIDRPLSIVDNISLQTQENTVIDQDQRQINVKDLIIDRQGNKFILEAANNQTIASISLKFVSYEHMIVMDNRSIFSDLIYDPVTAARQSRIKISAVVSDDWNGQLNAPGFILSQNNIKDWQPLTKYTKGEIVRYKNKLFSATQIIEPSDSFKFGQWTNSDFTELQQGLLPNLSNKSDQLANSYNVFSSNLERDQDLFSYGLIGFRPRQYMTELNLTDVSQVNLYQQFITNKGTITSAELFKFADIGRGITEFNVYENWAIQRALYGANANRSYYEIQLDQALLKSNPSTVQIIEPGQQCSADQPVLIGNLWKQSYKIPTTEILTELETQSVDNTLPSAGYVNLDDVEITVFDINDPASINQSLDQIGIGTRIWAAKINDYDWGIFRCYGISSNIIELTSNLDGTSTATFAGAHNLTAGSLVIIKQFNSDVDGVYRVQQTPSLTTIVIDYDFITGNQISISGIGIGLGLETVRVAQASDTGLLPESNQLIPGSKIWVDNDGTDHWQVIEKQDVFVDQRSYFPNLPKPGSQFGASVSQAVQNLFAVVGQSDYYRESDPATKIGAVVFYILDNNNRYIESETQEASAVGSRSFGHSVDIGNQNWIAVGAPNSQWVPTGQPTNTNVGFVTVINRQAGTGKFVQTQLLTPPVAAISSAAEFGASVAISQDQHWLYVGAPGINRAYVYGLNTVQNQTVSYTGDGSTIAFSYESSVIVDNSNNTNAAKQLSLTLNNQTLTEDVDFTVNAATQTVILASPAPDDSRLTIARRTATTFAGDGVAVAYTIADRLFTVDGIDSFTVFVDGVIQRPNIDYTFSTGTITFVKRDDNTIPNGTIQVRVSSYYQYVTEIEPPVVLDSGARFGASIASTTDGRQVIVGAPGTESVVAGKVYVYDRAVERIIIAADDSSTVYESSGVLAAPTFVSINKQYQTINDGKNLNTQYSVTGNSVVFDTAPAVGDILLIDVNQFEFLQEVSLPTPQSYDLFGTAIDMCSNDCSLYIGAPGADTAVFNSGLVQRNVNQSRVYGTISSPTAAPVVDVGDSIRINNVEVTVPPKPDLSQPTVNDLAAAINAAGIPNATASVIEQKLVLLVKDRKLSDNQNQLTVLPGLASADLWQRLNFETYVFTQTITSPAAVNNAQFGASVVIDSSASALVVGAPNANVFRPNLFDNGTTTFDAKATTISSTTGRSGAVYTFDMLMAANATIDNPNKFVFGQQVFDIKGNPGDRFGAAVSYVNQILLVTGPTADDHSNIADIGKLNSYFNQGSRSAWVPIRQQSPVVDISLINSVFTYDVTSGAKTDFFDFIDPLQGKILGAARQNIDYIGAVDPAAYNVGALNNYGKRWGDLHVGQIWWDISNVRFLNPYQEDLIYASRRWAQIFPGSSVEVYQWVASSEPPAEYTGTGVPKSIESFSVAEQLDSTGAVKTVYYFWVQGITEIASDARKTLSVDSIANYIENPRSTGIPYVAFVSPSATALYNAVDLVNANETILSIEFDRIKTDDSVHVEYELIPENRADGFVSETLYRKIQDSFAGADTSGSLVPDPTLRPANRYGVGVRPRQGMFVDRYAALKNYLSRVNNVLIRYPISESRSFDLLNSQEEMPLENSGEWDYKVANIEELSYQDFSEFDVGDRFLVEVDSTQNGLWTIYQVTSAQTFDSLLLYRVQTFKTNLYWSFVDWYQVGFNTKTKPVTEVENISDLDKLQLPIGSVVNVRKNSRGKFEIYQYESSGWVRVGLQDGTIRFNDELWDYAIARFGFDVEVFDSQYYDQAPIVETRKIIQAINEELLIDELEIERNLALIAIFNFILSEQLAPEWLTKTSLIDVDHVVRQLLPFQTYSLDNQNFVLDYIKEVKPYHTQIREFNLIYEGFDIYRGTLTDFDVPAYWNTNLEIPKFTSPILTPYTLSSARGDAHNNTDSDADVSNDIWAEEPWKFWFENRTMGIQSVRILNGGTGYTQAPIITVDEDLENFNDLPEFRAIVGAGGVIVEVEVIHPGSGFITTPKLKVTGVGSGAQLYAVLGNDLVRSIKTTLKYDRYQYNTDIVDWQPDTEYAAGSRVKQNNRVWLAENTVPESTIFNPGAWKSIPAGGLPITNPNQIIPNFNPIGQLGAVDRTYGYYQPGSDLPGLDLPLLIDGLSYPGVQVQGLDFTSTQTLDAIYESNFLDSFLGTRPTDINVDGGQFVDTYSSHAPEELVPGAVFDTLDMKVFTTPGADWLGNGHGWPTGTTNFEFRPELPLVQLFDLIRNAITLINLRTQQELFFNVDYFIDFTARTVTFSPLSVEIGDVIRTTVFAIGTTDVIFFGEFPYIGPNQALPAPAPFLDQVENFVTATGVSTVSFAGLVQDPVVLEVWNRTTRRLLIRGIDYIIDWSTLSVTVFNTNTSAGNIVQVVAFGIGGGNQLFKQSYFGREIGRTLFIPVPLNLVTQSVLFVNGEVMESNYGLVPQTFDKPENSGTLLLLDETLNPDDFVTVLLLADTIEVLPIIEPFDFTPFDSGNTPFQTGSFDFAGLATNSVNNDTQIGWSVPVTEFVPIVDGSVTVYPLVNFYSDTNISVSFVEKNGIRATPPAGVEYYGDASTEVYELPQRFGALPQAILDTDVQVWLKEINPVNPEDKGYVLQTLDVDYVVDPWIDDDTPRTITFATPPVANQQIFIYVTTTANYLIVPDVIPGKFILQWRNGFGLDLVAGDLVSVTGWNTTYDLDILTKVYKGPITTGATLIERFDPLTRTAPPNEPDPLDFTLGSFDFGNITGASGSFDYSEGIITVNNSLLLGRTIEDPSRLRVTRNGNRLFVGQDFTVNEQELVLLSGPISPADVIVITMVTDNVVPDALVFRVFKDMRGLDLTYRITSDTTTRLTQPLLPTDNTVFVERADGLAIPDLDRNQWGTVTVNGERILYRSIDLVNNTISGLLRGTAGTAIASHPTGSLVYNISEFNRLPIELQNNIIAKTYRSDGSSVEYSLDIDLTPFAIKPKPGQPLAPWPVSKSLVVFVGGVQQIESVDYTVSDIDPATIVFAEPPAAGIDIVVSVKQGKSWYQPGEITASNGVPLQETDTVAARFFRGLY